MQDNQVSITALITAYSRGYHATYDSPKIFDDFYASQLFSEEEHVFFRSRIAALLPYIDPQAAATNPDEETALHMVMQVNNGSTTLSRSSFTECCLDQSFAGGLEQYVILGAGLDTYALRHPELAETLQVFEVDHPATQADKLKRFQRVSPEIPANLHLVPVDFSRDDLKAALLKAGYRSEKTGFFSWLGVTYYLERSAIQSTLQTLSGLVSPGCELVFDYVDDEAFLPQQNSSKSRVTQNIVRQVGEPMKTGFRPAAIEAELKQFGFRTAENLSPQEIESRFFANRSDSYHASEFVHFIHAVKEKQ
jgi:methyltransferase (TIGR00027 family)